MGALQLRRIQTAIAQQITKELSETLGSTVSIASVDVNIFNTIVLNELFIKDLHNDTILYATKLKINVDNYDLSAREINIEDLEIIDTHVELKKYKSDSVFNHQFIIDRLKNEKNDPWKIALESVTIDNSNFVFLNEHKQFKTKGINYFDLETSEINGFLHNVLIENGSYSGQVNSLSTKEKTGFFLKKINCEALITTEETTLKQLQIKTLKSSIETDLKFKYSEYGSFFTFNDSVDLEATFNKSVLTTKDLAYFAPALKGLNKTFVISGDVSGKVNNIKGKNLVIRLKEGKSKFIGDAKFTGLPDIKKTFTHLNIKELSANYKDLKTIPSYPFTSGKPLKISPNIADLGIMKFRGTFTGLYKDLYTYGDFISDAGLLSVDLSMNYNEVLAQETYKGVVKTYDFNLGTLLGTELVGSTSANLVVKGSGLSATSAKANLEGTIANTFIKGYNYKNISIKGIAANQVFNGYLAVKDKNIDFDFNGIVDVSKARPEYNFNANIYSAQLNALNILSSQDSVTLTSIVNVNTRGNTLDDMEGYVNLKNITIKNEQKSFYSKSIYAAANYKKNQKEVILNSDIADINLKGTFQLKDIYTATKKVLIQYLPNSEPRLDVPNLTTEQNVNFDILLKNTKPFTDLLLPQLNIAQNTTVKGQLNSVNNSLNLTAASEQVSYKKLKAENLNLNLNTYDSLTLNAVSETLWVNDSLSITNIKLNQATKSNKSSANIHWGEKGNEHFLGDIGYEWKLNNQGSIMLKIPTSVFTLADSTWTLSMPEYATVDTNLIDIKKLSFYNGNQSLELSGTVRNSKKDQLTLALQNFDLSNLNFYTEDDNITLEGRVNGSSKIANIFHEPIFISSNQFSSFYINNSKVGDGAVESIWNNKRQVLFMHGTFNLGTRKNILLSGNYYPKRKKNSLDIDLNLQAIELELFKPFIKKYCSNFEGILAGNMSIKGTLKRPLLQGFVNIDAQNISVDYLNTTYRFKHRLLIENNSFYIQNLKVYDINNNIAEVNGEISHDNFKDFLLDIDIEANKLMCLNTTEAQNQLYFGTAFASGFANVSGKLNNITIDINAETESIEEKVNLLNLLAKDNTTKLYIPLSSTDDIGQSDFISFVKKGAKEDTKETYNLPLSGINVRLNIDVKDNAEIQLIFDQNVGDVIKAKGTGNIQLDITSAGDFKMYGNYIISEGDYLFTLKNIINKKFDIEKGSTIKWSGIPYNADLDINTTYKTRTLLSPFFDTATTITSGNDLNLNKRYPTHLGLNLSGDLMEPDIHFGLNFPTISSSTQQTILNYLNTDAELNRQVIPLLILNSFIRPTTLSNDGAAQPTLGTSTASNTSELISNQLNNMLSQLTNDFNVGVNYQPGDELTKDELDIAVSTQLFNDKLTIDGNLGTNNNSIEQDANTLVGDVNIDYKITKDGKARIKAFNKSNNNTLLTNGGTYTQGLGLLYREEFDTIGELLTRWFKRNKTN